ncbi:MAG: fatty acid desaturase [Actinomycetota bacterium]|nr:fatty acid desaturase [Actinomycetota bacterium]
MAGQQAVPSAQALAPYAQPHLGRALLDIATSVVPYFALTALMYVSLDVSYLLTLALAVPAAAFLLRTFILFHDCTHGAFVPTRRANTWLGIALGVVVFQAFHSWRYNHAVHHGTAGDLDRRGTGDVHTLTVAEFTAMPWRGRFLYRLFRNPLVMFGFGPLYALVLQPRLLRGSTQPRIRRSIIGTDIALAVVLGGLCWLVGWQAVLLVQAPAILLGGAAGVFLFYVQHQFEDTYWERRDDWSFAESALQGSSHLKLPQPLQFFTGNIGIHHVHHLNARIPNYNLQRAHDENPVFHAVPTLTLWEAVRAVRLKLWDEDRGRLVTFAEARPARARPVLSNTG